MDSPAESEGSGESEGGPLLPAHAPPAAWLLAVVVRGRQSLCSLSALRAMGGEERRQIEGGRREGKASEKEGIRLSGGARPSVLFFSVCANEAHAKTLQGKERRERREGWEWTSTEQTKEGTDRSFGLKEELRKRIKEKERSKIQRSGVARKEVGQRMLIKW
mmetsp:Transcript_30858/g.60774  ORF Transcript_30858/g.60774 Transcript_30858/m.60774 type:complete len:162 (+) Transcript_30858:1240-1725(+)